MRQPEALLLHEKDNVAVAIVDLAAGHVVPLLGPRRDQELTLLDDIPFGHKFALADIAAGAPLIKYGQIMGLATRPITRGEHVHVHNVESRRGRGDRGGG
ncbi:MAG: UxaA family hydrolase [Anaerolineae bacterium]